MTSGEGTLADREWPEFLRPGRPVEVAPNVRRVVAPNPGMMTGPGTNTYLIGEDRLAVVDPGPDDDRHLETILAEAAGRIGWILVTHSHVDHSPLWGRLRAASGAQVVAFGPAPALPAGAPGLDAHDRSFVPDLRLADGDRMRLGPDLAVEAVYTPGHTSNHLCFELSGTGLLFSGDHVMSGSTVVIAPPDGDMSVYLESLEKVRLRRPRRIAPGHGDMIDDPAAVLDDYLRHRRDRERQVLERLVGAGPEGTTPEDIVAALYADVPRQLHPVARFSVWAHLRKLLSDGIAQSPEPEDIEAPWTVRSV
jgi:glyoxylase-like metal-dependent hydrolase (beta-lactamase superfamily II)